MPLPNFAQKSSLNSMSHIKVQCELNREHVYQSTGRELIMTLTMSSFLANDIRTTFIVTPKNLLHRSPSQIDHSRKLHYISVLMLAVHTWSLWTCFTDWPAVISLDHGTTTTQVITAVHQSFCHTAIPDVVWSDGGPQFTYKLVNDFACCWGFTHKVSSPHNLQSYGKAEATVKSMKILLHTCWNGTTTYSVELYCNIAIYSQ